MKRYALLFMGGNPSKEDAQKNMKEWGDWMVLLTQEGKLESGLPFEMNGKMVKGPQNSVSDLQPNQNSIGGYMILKVDSLDEAVELSKQAPHMSLGGSTEVREVMEMPSM